MSIFKFDPNNTEGSFPTAMVVEGAELRKDDKAVATDLINLYDVNVVDPVNGDLLYYNAGNWINTATANICQICVELGIGGAGKCNVIDQSDPDNNNDNEFDSGYVVEGSRYSDASSGYYFLIALHENGTLWGVGANEHGQLGLNHTDEVLDDLVQIGTDNDWIYIECSSFNTYAIKSDGTLWGCGVNSYGQLGLGDTNERHVLTQIDTGSWTMVKAGASHLMGIKSDQKIYGCGRNDNGQLGQPEAVTHLENITLLNDSTFITLDASDDTTLAIGTNGRMYGCGYAYYGQLGIGTVSLLSPNRFYWVSSGSYTDWEKVYCSNWHSQAIKTDGTYWGTGRNNVGQLGFGDHIQRNYWTKQPLGETDWNEIITTKFHASIALKNNDDTIYGTGGTTFANVDINLNYVYNIFSPVETKLKPAKLCGAGRQTLIVLDVYGVLWRYTNDIYEEVLAYRRAGIEDPRSTDKDLFYTDIIWLDNYICIEEDTTVPVEERTGICDAPFDSLEEAFDYLRDTCVVIPETTILHVVLRSDLNIDTESSYNYLCGHRVVIEGSGHKITNKYYIDNDNYYPLINLNDNSCIQSIRNVKFDYDFESDEYTIVGEDYFVNGVLLTPANTTEYEHDVPHIDVSDLSTCSFTNCTYNGEYQIIVIKTITANVDYQKHTINIHPVSNNNSTVSFNEDVFSGISTSKAGITKIKDPSVDMTDWKVKNNSTVIVDNIDTHTLGIVNENSTVIIDGVKQ